MKKLFFLSFLPIIASTSYCLDETIYMHAHRGESSLAPENTVESIKLAFELGARMIETDFIMTKSGTIICVHNRKELLSVWGIDKDPADLTDEEIANARLAHPESTTKNTPTAVSLQSTICLQLSPKINPSSLKLNLDTQINSLIW